MGNNAQVEAAFTLRLEPLLADLYQKYGCEKYALSREEFCRILVSIAAKYLPVDPSDAELRQFCLGLRCEELVLARACAAGNEPAWQDFFARYREKLHDAALAITRDDMKARELAGCIYADLYGAPNREGLRVSKLNYYDGRGSLEGWLRIVLAQRHVNNYRSARHTVSLDEETEEGKQFAAREAEPSPHVDPRLNLATDHALASLSPEDRYVLACYFLDDLTLAKIAAILKVHESTISRRLEKLVKSLRKNILSTLTRNGMSRRQAEEALDIDVRDMAVDIRRHLTQDSAQVAFSKQERVIPAGEGQD
jgi:RNA polymerase sigma-70 factor, ECF subfamily